MSPPASDPAAAAPRAQSFPEAVFSPMQDGTRHGGGVAGARVLLVEDDYLVSIQAESALKDAGFDVVAVATDGREAVQAAADTKPEVVIMDIRLAGAADGVEAALEIFRAHGIRSVFATAHYDARMRRRAEAARPLGWLPKPYTMDALVWITSEAVGTLRRERGEDD